MIALYCWTPFFKNLYQLIACEIWPAEVFGNIGKAMAVQRSVQHRQDAVEGELAFNPRGNA